MGAQDDKVELRDARLTFRGTFRLAGQWRYMIQPQYNGFDVEPGDDKWQIAEVSLRRELGPTFGAITFDWWVNDVSWSKSGHQVTTRLTFLPV